MTKGLLISGGVLLALVVGLSIWVGRLRSQVKDGEALVVAITRQRDEAVKRARTALDEATIAGKEADHHKELATTAARERDALEARLEASRQRIKELLKQRPKSLPECMENLDVAAGHIVLLEDELKMQSIELRHTKEALASRDYQVSQMQLAVDNLNEGLRLEKSRTSAIEYTAKQKRKKRIVGFTIGAIGIAGAGIAGGYALGVR